MHIKQHCVFLLLFLQGPRLLPKYRVKSFLMSGRSLETPVDPHLYNSVKTGLVNLLGARSYFGSKVLTPYCYTLGNIAAALLPKCFPLQFTYRGLNICFCSFRCGDQTWWGGICAACKSQWGCIQKVNGCTYYTRLFRRLILLNVFEGVVFVMLQDSPLYRWTKEVHDKQEAAAWERSHQAATPEASGIWSCSG